MFVVVVYFFGGAVGELRGEEQRREGEESLERMGSEV